MKSRILIVGFIVFALVFQCCTQQVTAFQQAQVTTTPGLRSAPTMVYDPYNQLTVLFGGTSFEGGIHSLDDTWFYDYATDTWSEQTLAVHPTARANFAMAYCNETNEIVLYGGFGVTDTWSFNCSTQTWSQVITAHNPGVRHSLAMAYDPVLNSVVQFGGFGGDGWETDETWMFNCSSRDWTQLHPATTPLGRYGHVMVYDETVESVIFCCGNTAYDGHQDDTWRYDRSTSNWIEITTIGNPYQLKWPSMTYDSVNGKTILFGGQVGDEAVDTTFVYDAQSTTWINSNPDESPPGRINSGLSFDSTYGIALMYGGMDTEAGQFEGLWFYDYPENNWTEQWIERDPLTETVPHTTTNTESTTTGTETNTQTTTSDSEETGIDPMLLVIALPVIAGVAVVIVYFIRTKS